MRSQRNIGVSVTYQLRIMLRRCYVRFWESFLIGNNS